MAEISLEKLKKALDSLERGYKINPTELERDGIIQRFEFSVELSWKSAKKVLSKNGIDADVPKNIFREMASLGWVTNPALWLEFINYRNKASHIYNEEVAQEILAIVPSFIEESKNLLSALEKNR